MLKFQSKWVVQSAVAPDVSYCLVTLGPRPRAAIAHETSKLQAELRSLSQRLAALQIAYPALQLSDAGEFAPDQFGAVPAEVVTELECLLHVIYIVREQISHAYVARSLKELGGVEIDGRPATINEFLEYAASNHADQLYREVTAKVDELLETGSIAQSKPEQNALDTAQEAR